LIEQKHKKIMKKIVLAACFALSFAIPSAYAQSAQSAAPVDPDSAAAVKELLVAMHYRDTMQQTIDQMMENMPAMILQQVTASFNHDKAMTDAQKKDAIEKATGELPKATAAIAAVFNDPALMDEIAAEFVPLYARHFTAVEIRQLAAFYKTPVGMKMVAVMPQIAGETMQISQKVMMPRMSAAMQKITKPQ
jgi:hypothetical protein